MDNIKRPPPDPKPINYRAERKSDEFLRNAFILKKARSMRYVTKHRIKNSNIEFNLSIGWFEVRLRKGICEVTKIPFSFGSDLNGRSIPWCASVDRINPRKGYTVDNCRMVVLMFNTAKWFWSDEDVIRLARAVVQNFNLLRPNEEVYDGH